MLKQFNYPNTDFMDNESATESKVNKIYKTKKEILTDKTEKIKSQRATTEKDNLDLFFTLLLKSFSSKERYMLLNKILSMKWSNPDENLENHLQELINKKKCDEEELKKTLDYEYFLWDFSNWKKFFLSENEK